jgi:ubiquinone/menaquinone biosynthesis C-methylase UbiE
MSDNQPNPAVIAARNYEATLVTFTMRPFAALLLDDAGPQPGERVVDVACGTGVAARLAAPRVGALGTVVGVDLNPAMLAVARELPAPGGAAIEWREGNAQALPLPEAAFDLALCAHGLQFFPDRRGALREMLRVLRPGGRVAVSVWRSLEHSPASRLLWEAIARRFNTTTAVLLPSFGLGDADELRGLLESAGFVDVTVTPRSHTVREPRSPQLVARSLTSMSGMLPGYAAMSADERAALAQSVQAEIEPGLQAFVEGDEQLYPQSVHVGLGRKAG